MSHSTLRAKRATFRVGKTVLPDRSLLIKQKLVENAKMGHFELFSNNVIVVKRIILWVFFVPLLIVKLCLLSFGDGV